MTDTLHETQRDHLIRRLKGLREGEHGQMNIMSSPSPAMSLLQPTSEMDEEGGLDGSYDFADDTIAQTSHVQVRHSDPFAATASNPTVTAGTVTSRVSTDEFGALSAGMLFYLSISLSLFSPSVALVSSSLLVLDVQADRHPFPFKCT